jgi:DNA-3-methyladenine glycosylase I
MPPLSAIRRCTWPQDDPLMLSYHDHEWGVPVRGDRALFEHLVLDGFQAGLSWRLVLTRRAHLRHVFDGFDPERLARYDARKIAALLKDPGIIRNRQKVEAAVRNARAYLALREAGVSFSALLWQFVGGAPKLNHRRCLRDLPAETRESRALSRALRERGFAFVGPTIVYAFMQAAGLVNDHVVRCFRHAEVAALGLTRV